MESPARLGAQAVQLLALARRAGSEGLIYAAASEGRAERLSSLLGGLAPDLSVFVLPPWDCLPYDRPSPSRDVMGRAHADAR